MIDDAKREAEQSACSHVPTIGEHCAIECARCGLTLVDPATADPAEYRLAMAEVQRRLSAGFSPSTRQRRGSAPRE
jgi:hypothetical protein